MMALMTSCMKMDMEFSFNDASSIHGYIKDEEGNAISHIRVSIEGRDADGNGIFSMTGYSSIKGEFYMMVDKPLTQFPLSLAISLQDTDGEDNGGLFQPLSDHITIFEDMVLGSDPIIELDYRLTRATVSENTPQSL